nr:MAG TPA: hypothetical protein [Bacteriophage sp.]
MRFEFKPVIISSEIMRPCRGPDRAASIRPGGRQMHSRKFAFRPCLPKGSL